MYFICSFFVAGMYKPITMWVCAVPLWLWLRWNLHKLWAAKQSGQNVNNSISPKDTESGSLLVANFKSCQRQPQRKLATQICQRPRRWPTNQANNQTHFAQRKIFEFYIWELFMWEISYSEILEKFIVCELGFGKSLKILFRSHMKKEYFV